MLLMNYLLLKTLKHHKLMIKFLFNDVKTFITYIDDLDLIFDNEYLNYYEMVHSTARKPR